MINRRAYFSSEGSAISADTIAGGMIYACTNIRAGLLIAFMFSLIPIFVTFGNPTQTTHYIIASIFCILGAFMITLKTNPNLGLQAHAFITENIALVSLAAFLGTHRGAKVTHLRSKALEKHPRNATVCCIRI